MKPELQKIRYTQNQQMGHIFADIELVNGEDLLLSRRHIIGEKEIKKMSLHILVDTGSHMLAINATIQDVLQIPILGQRKAQLADGRFVECDLVAPVLLRFKNREVNCSALVLPGNAEPLLGLIPMEEMDVLIDPVREQLIVNPEHPDYALLSLK
jgi:clan AA aspartic protease